MLKQTVKDIMSAIALAYLPLLLIIPAVIEDKNATIKFPYILILIIFFLYSIAMFAVYLEVCCIVSFFLEKGERRKFDTALKVIGIVLTVSAAVSVFFIDKFPAVCFTLAGAIGVLLIIETVRAARLKRPFLSLKRKQTWLYTLITVLIVTGIFIASERIAEGKAMPDPDAAKVCIGIQGIN